MSPFDPEPAALFLTWTTYGSWLPGDGRGWTDDVGAWRESNPRLCRLVSGSMRQAPVRFDVRQRWTVERAVMEHCRYATWVLHAVQCRVTHVHVVVSAPGCKPRLVLGRLKAWCTRALRSVDHGSLGRRTWTKGGSTRWLPDEEALMRVVEYVRDAQDGGRFDRQA